MKKAKDFDCVEMKWRIQRRLREQYAGVPEEEARKRQREAIMSDPVLSRFMAKALTDRVTTTK
jgi:hypothetical protein